MKKNLDNFKYIKKSEITLDIIGKGFDDKLISKWKKNITSR